MTDPKTLIQTAVDTGEVTFDQVAGEDADLFESLADYFAFASEPALYNIARRLGLVAPEAPALSEIYRTLKDAADRSHHLDAAPATEYQMGALAGLIDDSGDRVQDVCSSNYVLTKVRAARLIDVYSK